MGELTYRQAVAAGIAQEMARDPSVVLIGEDVGAAGGVFKLTEGLFDKLAEELTEYVDSIAERATALGGRGGPDSVSFLGAVGRYGAVERRKIVDRPSGRAQGGGPDGPGPFR